MIRTPLDNAFYMAGGQSGVARLMGVERQTVNGWKSRGFPVRLCERLELVTNGILHRKLTRPNDWRKHWPELVKPRKAPAKAA